MTNYLIILWIINAYFINSQGGIKLKNYEININTLALIPLNDETTKIIEEEEEFIIKKSSLKIIDDNCKFFGSSYNGRLEGTKNILGVSHKAPIIIEESREIIFFPTKSPRLENCEWISLFNIKRYKKIGQNVLINFYCGKSITLNISYGIFDNQVLRATRLITLLNLRKKRLNNNENITFM